MQTERIAISRQAAASASETKAEVQAAHTNNKLEAAVRSSGSKAAESSLLQSQRQGSVRKMHQVLSDFSTARKVSYQFSKSIAKETASTTKVLTALISGPSQNSAQWVQTLGNFIDAYV